MPGDFYDRTGQQMLSRAVFCSLLLHMAIASLLLVHGLPDSDPPAMHHVMHARLLVPERSEIKMPAPPLIETAKGQRVRGAGSPSLPKNLVTTLSEQRLPDAGAVSENQLRHKLGRTATDAHAVSAEGVRRYRLGLGRVARHYREALRQQIPAGWQGEVGVVVGKLAGTGWPQADLSQSSGIDALDQAVLQMVRQAIQGVVLPEELQGRAFALTLPIRFSVDD